MLKRKTFLLPIFCATMAASAVPLNSAKVTTRLGASGYDDADYHNFPFGVYTSGISNYQGNYMKTYFDNLTCNFGNNQHGSCGYIAIGMVLSYYDTIWNDNIIPENFDAPSYSKDTNFLINRNSPGYKNEYTLDSNGKKQELAPEDDFHKFLVDNAVHANTRHPNTYHIDRKRSLDHYLKDILNLKGATYRGKIDFDKLFTGEAANNDFALLESTTEGWSEDNWGCINDDNSTDKPAEDAYEWVKRGYPVIASAGKYDGGHVFTAYELNGNDDLYCHLGHPGYTHYSVKKFMQENGFGLTSAISIVFNQKKYPQTPATNNYVCKNGSGTSYYRYDSKSAYICSFPNNSLLSYPYSIKSNGSITISSNYGYYSLSGTYQNINIKIADRTAPLYIMMNNFNATNGVNSTADNVPFIETTGSSIFDLHIVYSGKNSLTYSSSYKRPLSTYDKPSLNVDNARLYFKIANDGYNSLVIKGADGKNGANGAPGIEGSSSYYTPTNGTDGKNGGVGACGCNAVKAKVIDFTKACNLSLIGGNGGNGGNGGDGGAGGDGVKLNGKNGANGANGGNGGNGGDGGYGGLPAVGQIVGFLDLEYNNQLTPGTNGKGGNGGNGGDGGCGAMGGDAITHVKETKFLGIVLRRETIVDQTFNGGDGGDGGDGGLPGYSGQSCWYQSSFSEYFSLPKLGKTGTKGRGGYAGDRGYGGSNGGKAGNSGEPGK